MEKQTIPGWAVQQAHPIEKYPLKEGEWFCVTEKLNGVRCTYYRGELVSRTGKLFEGLEHIREALYNVAGHRYVLDGELTLRDKTGLSDNEAFRKAAGIINSDSPEKTEIVFTVFDMVGTGEFDTGHTIPYRERLGNLGVLRDFVLDRNPYVRVLNPMYDGRIPSVIPALLDVVVARGGEGLMINRDTPYLRKRNSGILKVKRFYTMDLPIVRLEEGEGKCAGMTGTVVVAYKGNEVGVGTGLTQKQRQSLWERRDELVGTLVEVKYKELSQDKETGLESLQFPVFVRLREDKSEVSYG